MCLGYMQILYAILYFLKNLNIPGFWCFGWGQDPEISLSQIPRELQYIKTVPLHISFHFILSRELLCVLFHSFHFIIMTTLWGSTESETCSVMSSSLWPMDYTVHGILQARILEWVASPFSKGSSQPRDRTQVSCMAGRFFPNWATVVAQEYWSG